MQKRAVPQVDEIEAAIRRYLLDEFDVEQEAELTRTTPLLSGGIMDSIALLKLVSHLEREYGIEVQAHEANEELMDTIAQIAQLVHGRMQPPR